MADEIRWMKETGNPEENRETYLQSGAQGEGEGAECRRSREGCFKLWRRMTDYLAGEGRGGLGTTSLIPGAATGWKRGRFRASLLRRYPDRRGAGFRCPFG